MLAEPLFGVNLLVTDVTVTLVGINPLTVNIKGNGLDKEDGFYDAIFDTNSFSRGVYIHRLTTNDFIHKEDDSN